MICGWAPVIHSTITAAMAPQSVILFLRREETFMDLLRRHLSHQTCPEVRSPKMDHYC
jgi:hypothetical protein